MAQGVDHLVVIISPIYFASPRMVLLQIIIGSVKV